MEPHENVTITSDILDDISYFLNGPITILFVTIGTVLNTFTVIALKMQLFKRKKIICYELILRNNASLMVLMDGPSRESVITKLYNVKSTYKVRPRVYIYFLWLTCSDTGLLISSLFMYSIPTMFYCYSTIYATLFPLWYMLCNFTFCASVLLMFAFMFERYRTLCSGFSSAVFARASMPAKVHATLALITIFALIFSLPRYFEISAVYHPEQQVYSLLRKPIASSMVYIIFYRIIGSLFFYSAIPYVLIFIMSFRVWYKMSIAFNERMELQCLSPSEMKNISSEKVFIALTIKFLISRLTSTFIDTIECIVGPDVFVMSSTATLFVNINNVVVIISSALNFFIFWAFSEKFRRSIRFPRFSYIKHIDGFVAKYMSL